MSSGLSKIMSLLILDEALDVAWKALVLLLCAAVAAAVAKNRSAAVRHRIWCCALSGAVLLPLFSITFPRWDFPVLPAGPIAKREAVAEMGPPLARAVARDRLADRATRPSKPRGGSDRFGEAAFRADVPAIGISLGAPTDRLSAGSEHARRPTSLEIGLLFGWGVGAAFFLIPLLVALASNRLLFSRCRVVRHGRWIELLSESDSRFRLARRVRVFETAEPIVPMTCGLIRPVVLVPENSRDWTDQRRRIVLLHELAHIQRRDVPMQVIGRLACSLYWFNPLGWYALRRLRLEQELACDDCVVSLGVKASEYAAQLVELAQSYRSPRLVFGVSMARSSTLERRIVSLLDRARAHGPLSRRLASVLAILSLALVITVAVVRPITRAEEKAGTTEAIATQERPNKQPAVSAPVTRNSASTAKHFVHGRVESPEGKSVAGAEVWIQRFCAGALLDDRLRRKEIPITAIGWSEWISVAKTDSRGNFRFDFDPLKLLELKKQGQLPLEMAATADGFGFGWAKSPAIDAQRDESARATIRLVKDLTIEGRLVTSDGKPGAGASVQLMWVLPPDTTKLDDYIPAVRAGKTPSFDPRIPTPVPGLPKAGIVDPHGRQPNALADQDGRFTLRGVGAERIARMMVWGPSIDLSTIVVVARPSPESNPRQNANGVLYLPKDEEDKPRTAGGGGFGGWNERGLDHYYSPFTHVSRPVRLLRGVVRDRDTGKPVSGAKVSWPGNPSTSDADGRFEMTAWPRRDRYEVHVDTTAGQYFNISLPVDDTPGDGPLEFNIDLPKGITARGRVTDKQTGEPVAGIVEYNPLFPNAYLDRLRINHGSTIDVIPRSASTIAADGTYELQVLPGPGLILVRAKGFYDGIMWPGHDVYAVPRIDMKRLSDVLGGVKPAGVVNTEDIINFDCGRGAFSMSRAGFKALALIRPDERDASLTQNLQAVRGRDIHGIVVDPDGKPISHVMVQGLSLDPVLNVFLSDDKFTVHCVSPDEPRLVVFRHGERHLQASEQIPPGFTGSLTVRLKYVRLKQVRPKETRP